MLFIEKVLYLYIRDCCFIILKRVLEVKKLYILSYILLALSCKDAPSLKEGIWRGSIGFSGKEVPFNFSLNISEKKITVFNADEKLDFSFVEDRDSIFIDSYVFNTQFRAKINHNSLDGFYFNYDKKHKFTFKAKLNQNDRFDDKPILVDDLAGKWETVFISGNREQKAILEIGYIKGNKLKATFDTESGDYRFLEGVINEKNEIKLSTFDGLHVFLFEAKLTNDDINGVLYIPNTNKYRKIKFKSKRNVSENYLRNPEEITFLKKGYKGISFNFDGIDGNMVSFPSEKYKNKVVILQIMGTWCPNCMDETAYLSNIYDKYKKDGLEIIGLAYEKQAKTLNTAIKFVKKSIKYHDAKYTFAIAQFDKLKDPKNSLPMLNGIFSFPTSIYIGRDGKIKKIHTGFSGPATMRYKEFIKENEAFIQELLKQ